MSTRGSSLIRLNPREMLRSSVGLLSRYSTPDARRLVRKLEDPGIRGLMHKANALIKMEGTLIEYRSVDPVRVRQELEVLLDIQVRREDVLFWISESGSAIEEVYSLSRLDWLWDFSWSYLLGRPRLFRPRHLLVYGAIRGVAFDGMKNVPLQAALNKVRKSRLRKKDRSIFRSAKDGDIEALVELGLTAEQAELAVVKVAGASV
ncbi:hypothetical protein LCGC14_0801080 [marine sediment metagenome]|uniref:Uncharacterized protein n=1 Tax=marine sediment metagenome TaxID=412755 RepID=A0A0F9Q9F5_9ZZZZ